MNMDFLDVKNGTDLDRYQSGSGFFLKSDNICLCVIFYDEKQFIN